MEKFPNQLKELLKEGNCPVDTILVVVDQDGGRHELKVNKALLASKSEYFLRKFENKFNEQKPEIVVGCDAEGLASALSWIMTVEVDLVDEETALHLLEVADYLLIDDLSNHCQKVMTGLLNAHKSFHTIFLILCR